MTLTTLLLLEGDGEEAGGGNNLEHFETAGALCSPFF
jgi:hypothetical protein